MIFRVLFFIHELSIIAAEYDGMRKNQPTLLILAAGMGSRYGGLKQLDIFGPNGETIIDYSIYDALLSGFKKLVFIIRKSFATEFVQRMEQRWKNQIEMEFIYQELETLPAGFHCPADRVKPWGTGHAVWVADSVVEDSFGVINADDFYGRKAMQILYDFLTQSHEFGVVAYELNKTLSEHGAVNRGICEVDASGYLVKIQERKNIQKDHQIFFEGEGNRQILFPNTPVSMNMWAFRKEYFAWAGSYLEEFLYREINNPNAEFYIPDLIQSKINREGLKVKVLNAQSSWFGVTYSEDKPAVAKAFNLMIQNGLYPSPLT